MSAREPPGSSLESLGAAVSDRDSLVSSTGARDVLFQEVVPLRGSLFSRGYLFCRGLFLLSRNRGLCVSEVVSVWDALPTTFMVKGPLYNFQGQASGSQDQKSVAGIVAPM